VTTTELGRLLRVFVSKTCAVFKTRELPREEAARGRRNAATRAKKGTTKGKEKATPRKEAKARTFNMCTYKLHALGDYVNAIWRHGTTDNYNTQVVSD